MTKEIALKVKIRPVQEEDLPILWNYIYGTDCTEWKKWDAPYFPLEHKDFETYQQGFRQKAEEYPPRSMAIEASGKVIGTVGYYWEHQDSNWLEAGIIIYDPDYWNGGYGTEALTLWVNLLFSSMPLARVGITTWSGNKRMMKAAEKIGMQLEGRMRKCRIVNGEYYDSIRMGVLREEWEKRA
ncbi:MULTISPECIES: GNAT family N-acetyltransferase [unclassified Cytobacillus]|uniref:GNAT family N-acetyltransferase n=1 Tax=unclassified Cytobacillus TaxID=2675268 RepID=UPI00135CAD41|nr:GNAT family protein [Cytobacillus sp. AMY 15.2]KAF0816007.1 Acetyltransferase, GNAT family [Bacillus sp. ZZV12-4809]MCM3092887.1 GNAT family N-acetyltransferase [Cytobacillus sp. AMY 15.2]